MSYTDYTVAEYIWIDAFGNLRSKCRTLPRSARYDGGFDILLNLKYTNNVLKKFPIWNFDGSSTGQASGDDSEVILVPQKIYRNIFMKNAVFVLCDCYDENNNPIGTNTRHGANLIMEKAKDHKPWFGMEQEYILYDNNTDKPLYWKSKMEGQGKYYCSVGSDRAFGRKIVNEHYQACLDTGLTISGINGEVMASQWEFQIGPCEGIDMGDQLTMARYLLHRVCENHNVYASLDPKPENDWNGSGCHTNYSTKSMRENDDGIKDIYNAIKKLENKHMDHIKVYGNNEKRLIGRHETSRIDKFTYGVSDRTASVRIPLLVQKEKKGYFEDRRPASDCDPYVVTSKIVQTTLLE